jgi:hypothetical protein
MPRSMDVNPGKWDDEKDYLFDNKDYSIIAGRYEGQNALGERWNGGDGEVGFPSQGGYPLWHVVPNFLALPILHGIVQELCIHPYEGSDRHLANTLKVIRRYSILD